MKFILLMMGLTILNTMNCNQTAYIYPVSLSSGVIKSATTAKWYNNHSGAVSVTFDIPVLTCRDAVNAVADRGLTVALEMATFYFQSKNKDYFRYIEYYWERGASFFGHGNRHLYYDTLSYETTFTEVDGCHKFMEEWNFPLPYAYAYPYGAGYKASTQKAVEDAGFICARAIGYNPNEVATNLGQIDQESLFICPDKQKLPQNWFCLPAVCVAKNVPNWTNNNAAMVALLQENLNKTAWLILMYHSIGLKNEVTYYPMDDFTKDLDFLVQSNTWVANMDVVARYIKERNNCKIFTDIVERTDDTCIIEHSAIDTVNTPYEKIPLTFVVQLVDSIPFNRCDITTADGIQNSCQVIKKRIMFNALPNGTITTLKLYTEL